MKRVIVFLILALIVMGPLPAISYTEGPVMNGGTITGKVLLDGKEPPSLAYSLVTNPDAEFCGRISTGTGWRVVDEFQVAPDGSLQNTIVFLDGISRGKPFPESSPARVTVEDCVFAPWVLVVKAMPITWLRV